MNSTTDRLAELLSLQSQPNDFGWIFLNFALCVLLSFALRAFYSRYSVTIAGKIHIASILPILSCVVFLVILIVKSSLALSLGLVGALSIVRFRTPVKEPEELVYLFMAIAIGLGFGAGQTVITLSITSMILLFIYLWISNRSAKTEEFNFSVRWNDSNVQVGSIVDLLGKYAQGITLVRLDRAPSGSVALFMLTMRPKEGLDEFIKSLTALDSSANVSIYGAH